MPTPQDHRPAVGLTLQSGLCRAVCIEQRISNPLLFGSSSFINEKTGRALLLCVVLPWLATVSFSSSHEAGFASWSLRLMLHPIHSLNWDFPRGGPVIFVLQIQQGEREHSVI